MVEKFLISLLYIISFKALGSLTAVNIHENRLRNSIKKSLSKWTLTRQIKNQLFFNFVATGIENVIVLLPRCLFAFLLSKFITYEWIKYNHQITYIFTRILTAIRLFIFSFLEILRRAIETLLLKIETFKKVLTEKTKVDSCFEKLPNLKKESLPLTEVSPSSDFVSKYKEKINLNNLEFIKRKLRRDIISQEKIKDTPYDFLLKTEARKKFFEVNLFDKGEFEKFRNIRKSAIDQISVNQEWFDLEYKSLTFAQKVGYKQRIAEYKNALKNLEKDFQNFAGEDFETYSTKLVEYSLSSINEHRINLANKFTKRK